MEHTEAAPMPKKMRDRRMNDPIIVRYSFGIVVASCSLLVHECNE